MMMQFAARGKYAWGWEEHLYYLRNLNVIVMENPKTYYAQLVELFDLEVFFLTISSSLWVIIYLLERFNWIYDFLLFTPALFNLLYYIIAKINFKKDIFDIPRITNIIPILANPINLIFSVPLSLYSLSGLSAVISFCTIILNIGLYIAYIRRIILLSKEKKENRPKIDMPSE